MRRRLHNPRALPEGYRQGLITAITVLLGFSLAFFRFSGFEVPGTWSVRSIGSTGATVIAVALQIAALFRPPRFEDNDAAEYRKTVWWFIASVIALALGLLFAFVESFGAPAWIRRVAVNNFMGNVFIFLTDIVNDCYRSSAAKQSPLVRGHTCA